ADLIDIINPLQHIPILSNVYRKISGDTIDPAARVAGGALFGGPIGAALGVVGLAFEKMSADDDAGIIPEGIEEVSNPSEAIVDAKTAPIIMNEPLSANVVKKQDSSNDPISTSDKVAIRGGWIVNAAYEGKSSALFEWARNPASEHLAQFQVSKNTPIDKPEEALGGRIINVANGGNTIYSPDNAPARITISGIDVRT
ncbi:MAG: hypothetical protein ACI9SC_001768, partial [Gammaproteobacteria bacterium]